MATDDRGVLIGRDLARDLVDVRDVVMGSGERRVDRVRRRATVMPVVLRRGRMNASLPAYDVTGNVTATPGTAKIGQAFTPTAGEPVFKVIDIHGYAIAANKVATFALADDGIAWYPIAGEC